MIRVALAAYNEERNIGALLDGIASACGAAEERFSVLVVDDGSRDGTAAACAERPEVSVISQPNAGFLKALDRALRETLVSASPDDVVVTMDADNTHPASLIPGMAARVRAGADVVIASRFRKGGRMVGVPWERELYSAGARVLMAAFVRVPGVRDYSTAFRAFRASLLKRAFETYPEGPLEGRGFAGMAAFLIRLSHLTRRIEEVPLVLRYDLKRGASSMNVGKTMAGYAEICWRSATGAYRPR